MAISALSAHATINTVVLTQDSYSFGVGGEFNANTTGRFLDNYNPMATVGTGFETFCIETTVDFYPNQTYTYDLTQVDSRGVALTMGAAYLYKQFAMGTLANFDYTDQAIRNADAGALQAAIWWLQGNQTYSGYPDPTTDIFYEDAISALGAANAVLPENGQYGVDVLQMWDGNVAAQNQLVVVPDNSATIGLLATGLGALAMMRRHLKTA